MSNRGDGSMSYQEVLAAASARRLEQERKRAQRAREIARDAAEDQEVGD